jgi:hypothetical protein
MPEIKLEEVEGFKVWITMLVNNKQGYWVPDANAQVDFYGKLSGHQCVHERGIGNSLCLPC